MAIQVSRKNFGTYYWQVSENDLVLPNLCQYQSKFFVINPSIIDGLSGTKNSTLTAEQLEDLVYITSQDVTLLAADFEDSNWNSLNWTVADDEAFALELKNFLLNNFGTRATNISLNNMVVVMTRGEINGTLYSIPFMFFGTHGDAVIEDPVPAEDIFSAGLQLAMPFINLNDINVEGRTSVLKTNTNFNVEIQTTVSKFYGASAYFNGTSAYIDLTNNGTDFDFGTGDFAIEFWFNGPADQNDKFILGFRAAAEEANLIITTGGPNGSTVGSLRVGGTSSGEISSSTLICDGSWHHCAVTSESGTVRLFVDGVLENSTANSTSFNIVTNRPRIGANDFHVSGTSSFLTGYLQDLRIYKGVAKYTANFTPPSSIVTVGNSNLLTSVLLHFDSSDIIDSSGEGHSLMLHNGAFLSPSVSKFGTKSLFVDGSDDFVRGTYSMDLEPVNQNFTLECWIYPTAIPGGVLGSIYAYSSDFHFGLGLRNDGGTPKIGYYASSQGSTWDILKADGGGANSLGAATIPLNTWTHVALVRNGNDWKGYVNGVEDMHVVSTSAVFIRPEPFYIGRWGNGGLRFTGYIDELRFSKGVARWTADFSAELPTEPYTTDANTKLLAHFEDGVARDSSLYNHEIGHVLTNGNIVPIGKFNGSLNIRDGDYVSVNHGTDLEVGSGNFTIDCWFKFEDFSYRTICAFHADFHLGIVVMPAGVNSAPTPRIGYFASSNGSTWDLVGGDVVGLGFNGQGSHTILPNTWYHVAFVRNGNNWLGFVNGELDLNLNVAGTVVSRVENLNIGRWGNNGYFAKGLIDEFRFSKGIARWTSTFTPPAAPYEQAYTTPANVVWDTFGQAVTNFNFGSDGKITPVVNASSFANSAHTSKVYKGDYDFEIEVNTGVTGGGKYFDMMIGINTPDYPIDNTYPPYPIKYGLYIYAGQPAFKFVYNADLNYAEIQPTVPDNTTYTFNFRRIAGVTSLLINGAPFAPAAGLDVTGDVQFFMNSYYNVGEISKAVQNISNGIDENVSLLMHFDSDIQDLSYNDFVFDVVGSGFTYEAGKFSQALIGNGSTCLTHELVPAGPLDLEDLDFTIDFWAKSNFDGGYKQVVNVYSGGGWDIQFLGTTFQAYFEASVTTAFLPVDVSALSTNDYHHYAVVRSGDTLTIYINGVASGSTPISGAVYNPINTPFTIIGLGGNNSGENFNGRLDELRVVKGVAVWTSNFTPPSTAYDNIGELDPPPEVLDSILLHLDGNANDSSGNNYTVVEDGGTTYTTGKFSQGFAGVGASGPVITFGAGDTDLNLGTQNFTIDFWFSKSGSAPYHLFGQGLSSIGGWDINVESDSSIGFHMYDSPYDLVTASAIISDDTLYHLAFVRNGNVLRIYIDGVVAAEDTNFSQPMVWNASYPMHIGGYNQGNQSQSLDGVIDELRILFGTAYWTANFTPPNTPWVI